MYQRSGTLLFTGMSREFAIQRNTEWADAVDDIVGAEEFLEYGEPLRLVHQDERTPAVRTASLLSQAHEIGTWSLEYLGPGFHVQLRILRRNRQARLDGWMSPARPITVLLASMLRKPVILETRVSDSGRFEFPVAPTGACRMSFVIDDGGRPPATPPFWV